MRRANLILFNTFNRGNEPVASRVRWQVPQRVNNIDTQGYKETRLKTSTEHVMTGWYWGSCHIEIATGLLLTQPVINLRVSPAFDNSKITIRYVIHQVAQSLTPDTPNFCLTPTPHITPNLNLHLSPNLLLCSILQAWGADPRSVWSSVGRFRQRQTQTVLLGVGQPDLLLGPPPFAPGISMTLGLFKPCQ